MPWDQVLLMILFMYLTKFMCLCVGMSCMHDNDDYIVVRSQPAVQTSGGVLEYGLQKSPRNFLVFRSIK